MNVYGVPCVAVVAGVPEIVGGRLRRRRRDRDRERRQRDATFGAVADRDHDVAERRPSCPSGGVPDNRPVLVSNAAQLGPAR